MANSWPRGSQLAVKKNHYPLYHIYLCKLRYVVYSRLLLLTYPFKRQSHKMVKHTQTIRRQFADELLECV